jgi:biotin transport system substrate-specific component
MPQRLVPSAQADASRQNVQPPMQTQAATLRLAVLPRGGLLTDALLVCAGTGLVALAAQISIHLGFTPVPITAQTFAVVLVGASLGSVRGTSSLLLYLLIGIAGAPVYAEHKHGWTVFSGSTGGYIFGFVVAAALTGYLAERRWDRSFSTAVAAMLSGNVVIYLFGLPWLHHSLHVSWAKTLEYGLYPFVAADVVKLYLAAAALPGAWRLVGRLKG